MYERKDKSHLLTSCFILCPHPSRGKTHLSPNPSLASSSFKLQYPSSVHCRSESLILQILPTECRVYFPSFDNGNRIRGGGDKGYFERDRIFGVSTVEEKGGNCYYWMMGLLRDDDR